jgi:HipA-like kinase
LWCHLSILHLEAQRILWRERRGSSSPVVVETTQGLYLVKLRGAAQGSAALVAEVVVGAIADTLGLPVPPRAVIPLRGDTPTNDANDELADLLAASVGDNLGFQYFARAHPFHLADLSTVSPDWASQVRWLDWLVLNPDRTAANPNILVVGSRRWLIDHGAALPFQHNWSAVTEQMPLRPEPPGPHLFAGVGTRLQEWDPLLTELIPRSRLEVILAGVPDSFLAPLLAPDASPARLARRRAAYVAFLWKRLRGERAFASNALPGAG